MHDIIRPLDLRQLAVGAGLFAGFVALLFAGSFVAPGRVELGIAQADGHRQRYRLNGLALFLGLAALVAGASALHLLTLARVLENFWGLFIAANLFAFVFTIYLARKGRRGRGAGEYLKDCFFGVEINPTWLGIDLKMFSYRPSLMGLGLLNVSFAVEQHRLFGFVSGRMWLFQIFYFAYLVNYFQFEYGMLYTWDIIAERFGWMLVWGDYVLVPFFYSLPGWYLVRRVDPIPAWEVAALVALYLLGFWLFRGTNEQKHRYKTDPRARIWGRPAEAVGGRLLVSGFWGIGRKLNYTGELCMYYAWTLPCGFGSIIPFLLPLWLTGFFPHRAWRDEQRCRAKYGELWSEYCRRARFRMIPFIY